MGEGMGDSGWEIGVFNCLGEVISGRGSMDWMGARKDGWTPELSRRKAGWTVGLAGTRRTG